MTTPPMDWYPDPADAARERYWDGTQWTHNTRPAQPVAPAPAVDPRFQPQYGQQQYGQPQNGQQQYGQQFGQQQYGPQGGAGQWPQYQDPQQQFPGQQQVFNPQLAYPVSVPGRDITADGVPVAGWWQRVGAYILDSILMGIVNGVLAAPFYPQLLDGFRRFMADFQQATNSGAQPPSSATILTDYGLETPLLYIGLIGLAVGLVYYTLLWRLRGQTLGQMVVGIRVVPTGEGRAAPGLSWGRSLRRSLTMLLLGQLSRVPVVGSVLGLVSLVSYLMPLWTSKRQALHDMAAGTQVVRTR